MIKTKYDLYIIYKDRVTPVAKKRVAKLVAASGGEVTKDPVGIVFEEMSEAATAAKMLSVLEGVDRVYLDEVRREVKALYIDGEGMPTRALGVSRRDCP